jgi:hypothetical protein
MELYRHSQVTLARGAEIAGVELDTFKEQLAEAEIPILVDEAPVEVRAGADLIQGLRAVERFLSGEVLARRTDSQRRV